MPVSWVRCRRGSCAPRVEEARRSGRWAVLVHGRGARREETIRAMPPLLAQGWTCLAPTYRNDEGVPSGPDGRYALGLSEWRDVEAAIQHAVDHGAARGAPRGVVDGWGHRAPGARPLPAGEPRLPRRARRAGHRLGRRAGPPRPRAPAAAPRRLARPDDDAPAVGAPARRRARERRPRARPTGSAGPTSCSTGCCSSTPPTTSSCRSGPSRELARVRPDLVTFEEWQVARHCKEWNTDPAALGVTRREFASG